MQWLSARLRHEYGIRRPASPKTLQFIWCSRKVARYSKLTLWSVFCDLAFLISIKSEVLSPDKRHNVVAPTGLVRDLRQCLNCLYPVRAVGDANQDLDELADCIGCPTPSVAQANLTIKINFNVLSSFSSSNILTICLHVFLQSLHPFEKNCVQGLPRDFRQNNPNTNKNSDGVSAQYPISFPVT
jgi:hypothetical protein